MRRSRGKISKINIKQIANKINKDRKNCEKSKKIRKINKEQKNEKLNYEDIEINEPTTQPNCKKELQPKTAVRLKKVVGKLNQVWLSQFFKNQNG